MSRQLDPESIADRQCDGYLARLDLLSLTTAEVRARLGARPRPEAMEQLGEATMARACWSQRQLFEVMVGFWSDQLHVCCPADEVWDTRHRYDADVIRRHALGRFDDLLVAATLHPAMLRWLGTATDAADAPGELPERHARVLLEHHTVGARAGFTDADVLSCARLLTGFTVGAAGTEFDPARRRTGSARLLGRAVNNRDATTGAATTKSVLRRLAAHPATAQRIAYALAVRFVSDTPPPTLVQRLAETYLARQTAIAPVLLRLFTSWEFEAASGTKIRRPYEDVIATVRALEMTPRGTGRGGLTDLYWLAADAGQAPLAWAGPEGCPDTAAHWQSTSMAARWRAHSTLVSTTGWGSPRLDGIAQPGRLLGSVLPTTHGELVAATARRLLATALPTTQYTAVLDYLGVTAATPLLADSPAVSSRFGELVVLLMHSPQHSRR